MRIVAVEAFDPDRVATRQRLFSDEIDTDEWIMFHGTSGFNAERIERDGFISLPGTSLYEQMQRVAAVFKNMNWCGESGGGYSVLKAFSLDHDFSERGRSPLFFAETSVRALLYASRNFAGGEKLRALRISFDDLESYLRDQNVRERHEAWMQRNFHALTMLNAAQFMLDEARPSRSIWIGCKAQWLNWRMCANSPTMPIDAMITVLFMRSR